MPGVRIDRLLASTAAILLFAGAASIASAEPKFGTTSETAAAGGDQRPVRRNNRSRQAPDKPRTDSRRPRSRRPRPPPGRCDRQAGGHGQHGVRARRAARGKDRTTGRRPCRGARPNHPRRPPRRRNRLSRQRRPRRVEPDDGHRAGDRTRRSGHAPAAQPATAAAATRFPLSAPPRRRRRHRTGRQRRRAAAARPGEATTAPADTAAPAEMPRLQLHRDNAPRRLPRDENAAAPRQRLRRSSPMPTRRSPRNCASSPTASSTASSAARRIGRLSMPITPPTVTRRSGSPTANSTTRAKAAIAYLGQVDADGLDPADYPVPNISAADHRSGRIGGSRNAALRLGRDLRPSCCDRARALVARQQLTFFMK